MRQDPWTFILFISITTAIFMAAHFYVGMRLIRHSGLPARTKKKLWITLLSLPFLSPLSFITRIFSSEGLLTDVIGWVAYLEMGFFSLLLGFVLLKDILLFGRYLIGRIKRVYRPGFRYERREFLGRSLNTAMFGAAFLFSGYGFYEARKQPALDEVLIPVPNLPDAFEGYSILQFSDLHVGPTIKRNFVRSVVEQINETGADLIVFTGDLVDGSVAGLENDVAPLKELQAVDGIYFITGNHEYYSGALAWIRHVEKLGFRPLLDAHDLIVREGHSLVLAGVTDYSAKRFIPEHTSDPHKAIAGAPEDSVKILLAHQPKNIFESAKAGFHLQLSGHTHGGQYIPWRYLVTFSQPYIQGLHKHENTLIYVNRGTGYWGPPLRLGVPSEISLIRLTRQRA